VGQGRGDPEGGAPVLRLALVAVRGDVELHVVVELARGDVVDVDANGGRLGVHLGQGAVDERAGDDSRLVPVVRGVEETSLPGRLRQHVDEGLRVGGLGEQAAEDGLRGRREECVLVLGGRVFRVHLVQEKRHGVLGRQLLSRGQRHRPRRGEEIAEGHRIEGGDSVDGGAEGLRPEGTGDLRRRREVRRERGVLDEPADLVGVEGEGLGVDRRDGLGATVLEVARRGLLRDRDPALVCGDDRDGGGVAAGSAGLRVVLEQDQVVARPLGAEGLGHQGQGVVGGLEHRLDLRQGVVQHAETAGDLVDE
ncbi:hypothetical protein ABE10_01145, partial [Bacillus toyonensis]|nr:hypothetical protein [Bacillus toyonensis]